VSPITTRPSSEDLSLPDRINFASGPLLKTPADVTAAFTDIPYLSVIHSQSESSCRRFDTAPLDASRPRESDSRQTATCSGLVEACLGVGAEYTIPARGIPEAIGHHVSARELEPIEEGRSSVKKYRLKFKKPGESKVLRSFVIRARFGDGAEASIARERSIAAALSKTGLVLMAGAECVKTPSQKTVIVYQDVQHAFGAVLRPLTEYYSKWINSYPTDDDIDRHSHLLEDAVCSITKIYDELTPLHNVPVSVLPDVLTRTQLPELIIDTAEDAEPGTTDVLVLPTRDGSVPRSIPNELAHSPFADLLSSPSPAWVRIECNFYGSLRYSRQPYLEFTCLGSPSSVIWVKATKPLLDHFRDRHPHRCDLVFRLPNEDVNPGFEVLSRLGASADGRMSHFEFMELCKAAPSILQRYRHCDLHCGNLLGDEHRIALIDVGDMELAPAALDVARLETAFWYDVAGATRIEEPEFQIILDSIGSHPPKALSAPAKALRGLIRGIRAGYTRASGTLAFDRPETSILYSHQILEYQRYSLADQTRQLPKAFDAFAQHWFLRLRTHVQSEQSEQPPSGAAGVTLKSLWKRALTSPEGILEAEAESFLNAMALHEHSSLDKPLTHLQQRLWDMVESENPFHSNRHIMLSGPTSSGKSTIAEMFMYGTCLLNARRNRAIYIAPTRALACAKWTELRERTTDESLREAILLSTGEDQTDDLRIKRGQFRVACLVYEKCNILFSREPSLLNVVGCVVVDELHMLSDIQRGPVLEVALTKVLNARRTSDVRRGSSQASECLKIVAITTEDHPNEAMRRFLSVFASRENKPISPLFVHSPQRPVTIHHWLILPPRNDGHSTPPVKIVDFTHSKDRQLRKSRLQELNREIYDAQAQSMARIYDERSVDNDLRTRLITLLLDRLQQKPRGHRILVFIPGRRRALDYARQLKNRRRDASLSPLPLNTAFAEQLEQTEDRRMAEALEECACFGVFVHHADMPRALRRVIEDICAASIGGDASQVLFATQTLSYGVNLAINDVVLFGHVFYSATRDRDTVSEPLDECELHNMAGRAGRLGPGGGEEGNVYILVPRDLNAYRDIIVRYYNKVSSIRSQLFVDIDKDQLRTLDHGPFRNLFESDPTDPYLAYSSLEATDFSYPFTRAVLDILRHLNTVPEMHANQESLVGRSVGDVVGFIENTLYAFEQAESVSVEALAAEKKYLTCAVLRVLSSCAKEPLQLVVEKPGAEPLYTIEERGEAVIDTGTDIRMVEPLLDLISRVRALWVETHAAGPIPPLLYLLCVIAQDEVCSSVIGYTPECAHARVGESWTGEMIRRNRERVKGWFLDALRRNSAESETLCERLVVLLDESKTLRKHSSHYEQGVTDGVLRLVSAMAMWIEGNDRSEVDAILEVFSDRNGADVARGRVERFNSFTEQLGWKMWFLSKMLATARGDVRISGGGERELLILSWRLRYGCGPEAVPFFLPRDVNCPRPVAKILLQNNVTPSVLLSTASVSDVGGLKREDLKRMQRGLRGVAIREFQQLMCTLTARDPMTVNHMVIKELLESISTGQLHSGMFAESVRQYYRDDPGPGQGFDDGIRAHFERLLRDDVELEEGTAEGKTGERGMLGMDARRGHGRFRVCDRASSGGLGVSLESRAVAGNEGRGEIVCFVGVQMNAKWRVWFGGEWQPLVQLIDHLQSYRHLVLVALPWLPPWRELPADVRRALKLRRGEPGTTTTFMTTGAFAFGVMMLAREFCGSKHLVEPMRTVNSGQGPPIIGCRRVLAAIEEIGGDPIPGQIREAVVQYFEVENW
jgi:hypothetical protein